MGCTPSVSFPQEAVAVKTKTLMCSLSISLASVQESGDIGLQGKQQAEEEDGKCCLFHSFTLTCHKRCAGCEMSDFFLFSPTWPPLRDDQANSRSALSHGDLDPFKFRWLIPLSALQVRLGNTAGKRPAHCHIIPTKSLTKYSH